MSKQKDKTPETPETVVETVIEDEAPLAHPMTTVISRPISAAEILEAKVGGAPLFSLFVSKPETVVVYNQADLNSLVKTKESMIRAVALGMARMEKGRDGDKNPIKVPLFYALTPFLYKAGGEISTIAVDKDGGILPIVSVIARGSGNDHLFQLCGGKTVLGQTKKALKSVPGLPKQCVEHATALMKDTDKLNSFRETVELQLDSFLDWESFIEAAGESADDGDLSLDVFDSPWI